MELDPLLAGDAFDAVEETFKEILDESLAPRGPDLLFEYVRDLGLPASSEVLDIGFGEGEYSVELAERFGFSVLGVDPVQRCVDDAKKHLEQIAGSSIAGERVSFRTGTVEKLPVADASIDLAWCRDVLTLVPDLEAAYGEINRVLRPGGRALVYQMFLTEKLQPGEYSDVLDPMGCFSQSMEPEVAESAIGRAGLEIASCEVIGSEWGEYAQEHWGQPTRSLIHIARLLRRPDLYIQKFGKQNYEIAVADCLWHIYRLLGKLSSRIYLLYKPLISR